MCMQSIVYVRAGVHACMMWDARVITESTVGILPDKIAVWLRIHLEMEYRSLLSRDHLGNQVGQQQENVRAIVQ